MLKRFFWMASGSDFDVLENCSRSEQIKHVGIGGTVFFTALMAAIASGFAINTVFENVIISIIFGVIWGLLIFNLDRFIVSSMKKRDNKWKEILQATPRIILALIIAVVIAKPLELKIFEKEINQVLLVQQNEMTLDNQEAIALQFQPEIERIENQISLLNAEEVSKVLEVDALYETYISEAEGRDGTLLLGKGPVYKEKRDKHDQKSEELKILRENNSLMANILEEELVTIRGNQKQKISDTQPIINGFDGLMARIKATDELPILPQLFIFLLFVCIETAPIFAKLISPKSEYDFLLLDYEDRISTWVKQKVHQRAELLNAETAVNSKVYAEVAEEDEIAMYKRQKARELLNFHTDVFIQDQKNAISNS